MAAPVRVIEPTQNPNNMPARPMRMVVNAPEPKREVWRVQEADIEELCHWLIPRLREKHYRVSDNSIVGLIKSSTMTPSVYFVRSAGACLMLELRLSALEPTGEVYERFMRIKAPTDAVASVRQPLIDEGVKCYKAGVEWAKAIGAVGIMDMGRNSDIPIDRLYDVASIAKKRQHYTIVFANGKA